MNKAQGAAIIALLTAILAVSGYAAYRGATPRTWEYHTDDVADKDYPAAMRIAGERGWELVFARRVTSQQGTPNYEMIFKRPKS